MRKVVEKLPGTGRPFNAILDPGKGASPLNFCNFEGFQNCRGNFASGNSDLMIGGGLIRASLYLDSH